MRKIFYIIEGETLAYALARTLLSQGYSVVYISTSREISEKILNLKAFHTSIEVIENDPTDINFIKSLELSPIRVGAVIVLSNDDARNFVVSWLIKKLYKDDLRVIALVNYPENEKLFKFYNIDSLCPTLWAQKLIEASLKYENLLNFFNPYADKVSVMEFNIKSTDFAANKKLRDIKFPSDSIVSLLIRKDNIYIPHGDTEIKPDDKLVVITFKENAPKVKKVLIKGKE